jgi:hypothetical protein
MHYPAPTAGPIVRPTLAPDGDTEIVNMTKAFHFRWLRARWARARRLAAVASLLGLSLPVAARAQAPAAAAAAPPAAAPAAPATPATTVTAPVPPPPAPAIPAAPEPAVAPAAPALPEPPPPAPKVVERLGASASIYGFVELDVARDTTQSFGDAAVNNTISRYATLAGDNPRLQFTARDSRFGFRLAAPEYGVIKTSAQFEMDFFGNQPPTANEDSTYTSATMRMRLYFVKFETPFIDVLAGQYHDLFGWGGAGFYPSTVAFLGVPGELYHRNEQLRISKKVDLAQAELEVAVAAVRPAQRDSALPDLEGGVRVALGSWRGASAQGASLPKVAPLSLGVSGIGRRFSVPPFSPLPGNQQKATGWGAAVNLFLPILPAHGDDLANALTLTAEASMGAGIANLYTGLTGGVLFPALPNPLMSLPVPMYVPGLDQGLATFDASNTLRAVKWRALLVGAQYYLPIEMGRRLRLSAIYSLLQSPNDVQLTPIEGVPYVFSKAEYFDGSLFWTPTPSAQLGLSVQQERQTFGDGLHGRNTRGEIAVYYFF